MKKGAVLTFVNVGLVWAVLILSLAGMATAMTIWNSPNFTIFMGFVAMLSLSYLGYRHFTAKAGGFEASVGEDEKKDTPWSSS